MPEDPASIHTAATGQGLTLEGRLAVPKGHRTYPGVVMCHPHPTQGGAMSNGVVVALCHAMAERHIATLRFNFRGVGKSQGEYSGGPGEEEDAIAALGVLIAHPRVDPARIGLAGYSFGARIAMAVAPRDARVKALAAVSAIARTLEDSASLAAFPGPKFFIMGDHDRFFAGEDLARLVNGLPEPKEFRVVPNIDHFWFGSETLAGDAVAEFFAAAFQDART